MSLVFNMVGGSSGGGGGPSASDAILTVTVPTGSTVTATKGGVTLTPTMWVQAADATQECALFVISSAQFDATTPWTVTATLGTDSATATVLIDSNKQYDVELSYHYYLYNRGDQFVDRTGGWAARRDSTVFQSDRIHLVGTGGSNVNFIYTVNKVAKLNFTKLVFVVSNTAFGTTNNSGVTVGFGKTQSSSDISPYKLVKSEGIHTIDISGVTDTSRYCVMYVYVNGESCDITQVWLE